VNKGFAAVLLLFLVLCGTLGFVVFGLNIVGRADVLKSLVLPDVKSILTVCTTMVVIIITSQVLSFWVARLGKSVVHSYFDRRWLPKENNSESYTTSYGERLEKVVLPSYLGTTVWDLAAHTFPSMFVVSLIASIAVYVILTVVGIGAFQVWVILTLLILACNFILVPVTYWIKEWKRKYTKFIIFSFNVIYIGVKTPILALFFWKGSLPQKSRTPITEVLEIQMSADPQQFKEEYRTSWLRDQWTSILSRRVGLRTIFLRSRSNKAEDIILWIDNGPAIDKILRNLSEKALRSQLGAGLIAQTVAKIEAEGEPSALHKQTRVESYLQNFQHGQQTYDLFRVVDPGLYDNQGNPIESVSVAVDRMHAADVSALFRPERKRKTDSDNIDTTKPHRTEEKHSDENSL